MSYRLVNQISGIQGVVSGSTGGVATVDVPPNCRLHDLRWFCTNGGVPVDISTLIRYQRISVNGVVMRDLTPQHIKAIAAANGEALDVGEVVNYFTEPWRRGLLGDEATSWDIAGQAKMTVEFGLLSGVSNPGIIGSRTFDYRRNERAGANGQKELFLAPIKQSQFSYTLSGGQNDIINLPIQNPIHRLYMFPGTPGSLQHIEIYVDSTKILEGDLLSSYGPNDLLSMYRDYGVVTDPTGAFVPIFFDFSNKISDVLTVGREMVVRVWSSVTQNMGILIETRPNAYV